ncbi:MAG: thymidine phosphorylase [Candidatus Levybacteria bacterium]|nr:thymidine phosphorylase [Candidatus Levybacteria bacterium]
MDSSDEAQLQQRAVEAIRKKLVGKKLSYKDVYTVMDEIVNKRLGDVLTTYFAASGYSKGFSNQELYFLTKAMVETGDRLKFKGIVADKHSIGGVAGTRTTLIVVPIIAAAGFKIPKSSSRAITTPTGTADDMEILAPVELTKEKIYEVVAKTNGCLVWGGKFNLAPADDILINVEKPLLFESYDKVLVSIMAKKIAFGSNHVVIDVPYGKMVKVHSIKDAKILKNKFEYLAKRFHIKIRVIINRTDEPAGRGIGPILETREALRVLQQKPNKPLDLEIRSLNLSANLLELCLEDSPQRLQDEIKEKYGNCFGWATRLLEEGTAFKKFEEIIKAQGGKNNMDSEDLKPGSFSFEVKAGKRGVIKKIDGMNLTLVAKMLGAPVEKGAGIYLNKKIGEKFEKGDTVYTLFAQTVYNLEETKKALDNFKIMAIA